jgi:hypothetical protein
MHLMGMCLIGALGVLGGVRKPEPPRNYN